MCHAKGRKGAAVPLQWKSIVIVAIVLFVSRRVLAQGPCPVMFISGNADQDSIKLSFMNQGKTPIEQLMLSCSPPLNRTTRGEVCHKESGIFLPGMKYSIVFTYPGAGRHLVVISLASAWLASGVMWNSTRANACRALRVVKEK
jgi:hypothetical protein